MADGGGWGGMLVGGGRGVNSRSVGGVVDVSVFLNKVCSFPMRLARQEADKGLRSRR